MDEVNMRRIAACLAVLAISIPSENGALAKISPDPVDLCATLHQESAERLSKAPNGYYPAKWEMASFDGKSVTLALVVSEAAGKKRHSGFTCKISPDGIVHL
jgi:hypothetical protein